MPPPSSPACDERYVEPARPEPHKRGPAHGIHLHAAHDMFHSLGVVGCSNFAREYVEALRPHHHVTKSLSVQNLMDGLGEGLRRAAAVGGQVQYVSYSGPVHGAVMDTVPCYAAPSQAFTLIRSGEGGGVWQVTGGRAHGLRTGDVLDGGGYELTEVYDYHSTVVRRQRGAPEQHFLKRALPLIASIAVVDNTTGVFQSKEVDTKIAMHE